MQSCEASGAAWGPCTGCPSGLDAAADGALVDGRRPGPRDAAPGDAPRIEAAPKPDLARDLPPPPDKPKPDKPKPDKPAPKPDVGPCDGALKDGTLSKGQTGSATSGGNTLSYTLKDFDISLPQVLMTIKENAGVPYDWVFVQNASEKTGNGFIVTVLAVNKSALTARVCVKHP
jgi:hypothetical protein